VRIISKLFHFGNKIVNINIEMLMHLKFVLKYMLNKYLHLNRLGSQKNMLNKAYLHHHHKTLFYMNIIYCLYYKFANPKKNMMSIELKIHNFNNYNDIFDKQYLYWSLQSNYRNNHLDIHILRLKDI